MPFSTATNSRQRKILATYPRNCTFAQLLHWHLKEWGTRPAGPPQRWEDAEFTARVMGTTLDVTSRDKNLKNWLGKGAAPDGNYYDAIVEVLFGDADAYKDWRIDLKEAQKFSKKHGNLWEPPKRPVSYGTLETQDSTDRVASAARENIALIVKRLEQGFFGRSEELAMVDEFVHRRMQSDPHGLLVITAPPGFGKSALAAHWCTINEGKHNRLVARHFCSYSGGSATTSVEQVYQHLHQQIADFLDQSVDSQSGHFNSLVDILKTPLPEGRELIIWLDGIDEADGLVECFLPETLGRGICIIVSARSDGEEVPAYLEPWLKGGMAASHHPVRRSLKLFTSEDTELLVEGLFEMRGLQVPRFLVSRIYKNSGHGHPLCARLMAETSVEAVSNNQVLRVEELPESLIGIAKNELVTWERDDRWSSLLPILACLTIARDAVDVHDLEALLGREVYPSTFPSRILRWLNVTQGAHTTAPILSFTHPLLREAFGVVLGYRRTQVMRAVHARFSGKSFDQWPMSLFRYLPIELIEAAELGPAEQLLSDLEFVAARSAHLGYEECSQRMLEDWRALCRAHQPSFNLYQVAGNLTEPARHYRFWNDNRYLLCDPNSPDFKGNWDQVIQAIRLLGDAAYAPSTALDEAAMESALVSVTELGSDIREFFPLSGRKGFLSVADDDALRLHDLTCDVLAVMRGHSDFIRGFIEIRGADKFLSWSDDETVRIWAPTGEEVSLLHSKAGAVWGAVPLNQQRIVSWSADGSLRLWMPDGSNRVLLSEDLFHTHEVLAFHDGAHFLSSHTDGTRRLWGREGDLQASVSHKIYDSDYTTLLADGATFLFWGNSGLALWRPATNFYKRLDYRHDDDIVGAIPLKSRGGFLTWSKDCTLRVRGEEGEEIAVFQGHAEPVVEAQLLENGDGVLSWTTKQILVWDNEGNQRLKISSNRIWFRGVIALRANEGYVSWDYHKVQLWSGTGVLLNMWVYPAKTYYRIEEVIVGNQPHHYIVRLTNKLCIIRLRPNLRSVEVAAFRGRVCIPLGSGGGGISSE